MRVSAEEEDNGLDISEHGMYGYPEQFIPSAELVVIPEVGHLIRGGELAGLVRNPSYAGITPQFWGSLDAVGSQSSWRVHGLLNCGKGEPGQLMRVSHGTAPARFRDVEVGVA